MRNGVCARPQRNIERKARKLFAILAEVEDLLEAVPRSSQQLVCMSRIDDAADLLTRSFVELCTNQIHARMSTREAHARPGNVHRCRIWNVQRPDCAGSSQRLPPLGSALVMRTQRPRNIGGDTRKEDRDLAFQIKTREIIVVLFWNFQSVTDKH